MGLNVGGVAINPAPGACGTSGLSALGSSMDPVNPVEVLASIQSRLDTAESRANSNPGESND